ncbi:hypothetical protein SEVIR_7G193000v4 [Setaria viridis]|uniref:Uncharacterized protein n=1 Tax=Setaria viridis TaxID=4556 RepID=A0A4V6D495_SETVI|nr:hypothetical protein SEVIR_7G193000v2 [Setaria viridis]
MLLLQFCSAFCQLHCFEMGSRWLAWRGPIQRLLCRATGRDCLLLRTAHCCLLAFTNSSIPTYTLYVTYLLVNCALVRSSFLLEIKFLAQLACTDRLVGCTLVLYLYASKER